MIRINLVAERRRVAHTQASGSRFSFDAETAAVWCLVVTLVIGGLVYGGYWFYLNRDLRLRRGEIAEAQETVDRLKPVLEELDRFVVKSEELTHKISVITDLRDNQRGPVRIMDEVSKALPELLWLDNLALKGRLVNITGRSFTTNAVASFIENLDRVEEFLEPVLKSTSWNGKAYVFQVSFRFRIVPVRSSEVDTEDLTGNEIGTTAPAR